MKAALLACIVLLLGSCLLWRSARVEDSHAAARFHEDLRLAILTVEDLTVEKELDAEAVRTDALAIVKLLLAKHAPAAAQESAGGGGRYAARILLKEKIFRRGYRTLNSVTLELEVASEGSAEPSFVYLASEETENTLSSYRYLYRILNLAFRKLYR